MGDPHSIPAPFRCTYPRSAQVPSGGGVSGRPAQPGSDSPRSPGPAGDRPSGRPLSALRPDAEQPPAAWPHCRPVCMQVAPGARLTLAGLTLSILSPALAVTNLTAPRLTWADNSGQSLPGVLGVVLPGWLSFAPLPGWLQAQDAVYGLAVTGTNATLTVQDSVSCWLAPTCPCRMLSRPRVRRCCCADSSLHDLPAGFLASHLHAVSLSGGNRPHRAAGLLLACFRPSALAWSARPSAGQLPPHGLACRGSSSTRQALALACTATAVLAARQWPRPTGHCCRQATADSDQHVHLDCSICAVLTGSRALQVTLLNTTLTCLQPPFATGAQPFSPSSALVDATAAVAAACTVLTLLVVRKPSLLGRQAAAVGADTMWVQLAWAFVRWAQRPATDGYTNEKAYQASTLYRQEWTAPDVAGFAQRQEPGDQLCTLKGCVWLEQQRPSSAQHHP